MSSRDKVCPTCGLGTGERLGMLGRKVWYRCRDCGIEFYVGEERMKERVPKTHRHKARPAYSLVGYSETAPSYHLEHCTVGKCKVTRTTYCPHRRGDSEVHLGLGTQCPICDA